MVIAVTVTGRCRLYRSSRDVCHARVEGNLGGIPLHVEIVQWDAGIIPLKRESVDVVICDMPFGMKHGNYRKNRRLYPVFFGEVLRILSRSGKVGAHRV